MNNFDIKTLRDAIMGFYVARDRTAYSYKRFPEFNNKEECARKLTEKGAYGLEKAIDDLRNLSALLEGMHKERPFPERP